MLVQKPVAKRGRLLRISLCIYIPTLLFLAAVAIACRFSGVPVRFLTRDPITAISQDAPAYAGCVSNLGILIWCSTGAICLFAGTQIHFQSRRAETAVFLIASGIATMGLTLDDFYLLHEEVLPDHFYLPQRLVYGLYGMLAGLYLIRFKKSILQTDYALLLLAFTFFAASLSVDALPKEDIYVPFFGEPFAVRHLIEDGCKFLGIVSWSAYYILLSAASVAPTTD